MRKTMIEWKEILSSDIKRNANIGNNDLICTNVTALLFLISLFWGFFVLQHYLL